MSMTQVKKHAGRVGRLAYAQTENLGRLAYTQTENLGRLTQDQWHKLGLPNVRANYLGSIFILCAFLLIVYVGYKAFKTGVSSTTSNLIVVLIVVIIIFVLYNFDEQVLSRFGGKNKFWAHSDF
jgi:Flp pilus assembly protein TadB